MYFGAKRSHNFSPGPANTGATSSSEVFRRNARNSKIFLQPFKKKLYQPREKTKVFRNFELMTFAGGLVRLPPHEIKFARQAARRHFDGQRFRLAGDEGRRRDVRAI